MGTVAPLAKVSTAMFPRVPSVVVIAIILLAVVATVDRVFTAPDRIQKRLAVAKAVCNESGGQWVIDDERNPVCKRN